MQTAPANRTHAQNRFIRRLSNKTGANGDKGTPIPGPLTPVEIAHKARRRERRLKKAIEDKLEIPQAIQRIQTRLHALSKAPETVDNLVETEALKSALKRLNKSLSRAEHLITVLS